MQPEVVNLSNILIGGCVPELKHHLKAPVVVTLQGDDLFLEDLIEPYKQQALDEIRRVAEDVDAFIVFSRFYADFMADYLGLDRQKFHVVPLGLNLDDYPVPAAVDGSRYRRSATSPGFCPEKGFHHLVEAFIELAQRTGFDRIRLHAAGWLGRRDEDFFRQQIQKIERAGLADRFHYAGSVERRQKLAFFGAIDVLSVPTVYQDPKGLFVLEAWASGLPVVQPAHGAFPELFSGVAGGRLVRPGDVGHLTDALAELLSDGDLRLAGRNGQQAVRRVLRPSKRRPPRWMFIAAC